MTRNERLLRFAPIAITGLALMLRLASLALTKGTPLAGDEREYFVLASQLARGEVLSPMGERPPLIPSFFGGLLALSGGSLYAVRVGNAFVGALLVLPAWMLGRRIGGRRTAIAAAGLAAVYPSFVTTSHGLWSEPLYMLVSLSAAALLCADRGGTDFRSLARISLAGAMLGSAALMREVGAVFPVLAAAWLAAGGSDTKRRLLRPVLLLSVFAGVVLPWTAYINGYVDYHANTGGFERGAAPLALLSRTTWQNLYIGNAGETTIVDRRGRERTVRPKQHYYTLGPTRLETEAIARIFALDAIAARLPWWPFEKIASEVPKLFAPTSVVQHRLLARSGGSENEWRYRIGFAPLARKDGRRAAAVLIALGYAALAVTGAGGLLAMRDARVATLLGLYAVSHVLPSLAAFGSSRFRLPMMAVLLVGSAYLAVNGSKLRELPRGRMIAVALAMTGIGGLIASQWHAALSAVWG